MDRNIKDVHSLFDLLSQDGVIQSVPGDYDIRQGLTCQPLTHQDITKNLPITHAYMRSLSYFESLIYQINGNVRVMGKGKRQTVSEQGRLQAAKQKFRYDAAHGPLHMRLDQPDSSGHGGNSDTAQMGRNFFTDEKRDLIMNLVQGTDTERSLLKILHENFSLILRVISSKSREVKVDVFEEFCIETYMLLVQSFPWASVPQSIHRILAHSAEKIRMNENFGLGSLSEEGLEASHKLVRRFRSLLARKTSLSDNLRDVFKHLWIRSDPIIRQHARKFHCTNCSATGHTKRSCPMLKSTCTTETNAILETFFVTDV